MNKTLQQLSVLSVSLALSGAALAAGSTSEPSFVYLAPETSSFWHTVSGRAVTLPIDYPRGVESATLTVRSSTASQTYAVTEDWYMLTLPAATDETNEDVYELTLEFPDGTVRTARLAVLADAECGATSGTRCLVTKNTSKWGRIPPHGVIPVPAGTTAFTVNGAPVAEGDPGFTGAQGWYALPNLALGEQVALSLTANGVTESAALTVQYAPGFAIILR